MTEKQKPKKIHQGSQYRVLLRFLASQEPGTLLTIRQIADLAYPDRGYKPASIYSFLHEAKLYLEESGLDAEIIAESEVKDGKQLRKKRYGLRGAVVFPEAIKVERTPEEEEAFRRYYEEFYKRVVTAQIRKGRSIENAEDAAQYAFLRVYNMPNFSRMIHDGTYLLSTLHRVAGNELINNWRKKRRETEMEDGVDYQIPTSPKSVEDEVIGADTRDLINKAMRGMKREDKELIHMRVVQELSYEHIASVLGVSETALRVRFLRLRRSLQIRLKPLQNDES